MLQTDRLILRCWQPGDAELFNRHCNTAAVMRWLGGVQSRRELREDIAYFADCQDKYGHTFWAMERRSDGSFLGFCGFVLVEDADSTVEGELEIGWRVRADEWRHGYAEEAARACLKWAFDGLAAQRAVSRTAMTNAASRKLMEKLGMRLQPELAYDPEDGSERLVVYTISKNDARASAALK